MFGRSHSLAFSAPLSDWRAGMASAAGCTAVSHLFASRFLFLASEAESRCDFPLARSRFLQAIRHDPTPRAGLEFARFLCSARRVEDAILVAQDAWQLAKRRQSPQEIAMCCRRLAILFERAGNLSQA